MLPNMKKTIITLTNIFLFILGTSTQYISGQSEYTIDKTKSIGEIPIQHSMVNGALTYSIPIDVYPGNNGIQPNISLNYNSFSRDGVAGYGWSIGGLSSIYLVNHNQYFDGYTDESKMDKAGAYTLDGTRLINLNTGTSDAINYQTEQGQILVTAYLSSNNINYFQVKYPNGNKAVYGHTTNTAGELSYPITRMEDVLGNYIEYKYEKAGNIYYASEINYGSKRTKIGTLKFMYLNRSSMPTLYTHGTSVMQEKYLKNVETYFNAQKLRIFTLTHDNSTSLLLKRIDCSNNQGESLNPVSFSYYGDNTAGNSMAFSTSENDLGIFTLKLEHKIEDIPMIKAAFDNDPSHTGLLLFTAPGSPYAVWKESWGHGAPKFGSSVNDILGEGAKFMALVDIKNANSPVAIPIGKGYIDAVVADIDGDGIDEFIKINSDNNANKTYEVVTYTAYKINSNSYVEKNKFNINFSEYTTAPHYEGDSFIEYIYSPAWRQHVVCNFLGDGKHNVLSISSGKDFQGNNRQSELNMISFDSKKVLFSANFDYNHELDYLFLIDYDGDGKAELAKVREGKLSIYRFNKTAAGSINLSTLVSNYILAANTTLKLPNDIAIGDLNGDGKTDFLVRPINGGVTWTAYYATNNTAVFEKKEMPVCAHDGSATYYLQDVNRDGCIDLIKCKNYQVLSCYLGNKNGTISTQEEKILTLSESAKFVPNNIFQNHQLHQLLGVKSRKIVNIVSLQNKGLDNLLVGSVNSLGVESRHSYISLTEKYDIGYETGSLLLYPYNLINGDMHLLRNDFTKLNGKTLSELKYKYKGGVIDITGKGFICYEKIDITDNLRAQTTTQIYDYNYMGALKSLDSPYNSATFNYTKNIQSNKIAGILLTNKTEKDKLKGVSITTTYTYDSYNNPTTEVLDYGNGLKTTRTNTYSNHNSGSLYKLGELVSQTVKKETPSGNSTTKQVLEYNASRQVASVKNYYNNNITLEEAFSYNTSNELSETKSKKYSSQNWISKKYTYDDFGRCKRETDAINNYVDYTYNAYGRLSSRKDHKLNEVKYEYDNWGNRTKTTNPDGTVESKVLSWVSAPAEAVYQITNIATGAPVSYVFYDALGREIRNGVQRVDGSICYIDNIFNAKGELIKTSLPFKTGPSLWDTYEYDSYGRLSRMKSASGKVDEYGYSNYRETVLSEGQLTTNHYNSLGQTVLVEGNGGEIAYGYRPDGQLSNIILSDEDGNNTITTFFEYDNYGRQIKVIDPSAGTKLIAYDTSGNINKETDSDGNTVVTTYDNLNRVTGKVTTTRSNNEIYATGYSYNSDGLLASETGANSNPVRRDYTYDKYLRVDTEKETVADGKWLQKKYTYENGTVAAVVYLSNTGEIGTEKFVYSNGYAKEKFFNNIPYWRLEAENTLGIPTNVTTGKVSRVYEYDNTGRLKSRRVLVNSSVIQDFAYNFNTNTSNLVSRKDVKRGLTENFSYDSYNRLESDGKDLVWYDFKGNITLKSDAGTFLYSNEDKPYAITHSFKSNSQAIPSRAQQVTYNGLMRPGSIVENGYTVTFTYDQDGNRNKFSLKKNNTEQLTRYYIGGQYEIESGLTGNKERLYLGGDPYSASSVYVKENNAWNLYHICRDYLGSITHVLDTNGNLKQELSYDAWGRLRNPSTHKAYEPDNEPVLFLGRGYTGHEHLTWYGLINMNSRLYDPAIGRFLSPDPDLKSPGLLQNYNRYSYALNNPLKYTDPNGENPFLVFGLGALFGYFANAYHTNDWGWSSIGSGVFVGMGMGTTYAMSGGGNPWAHSLQSYSMMIDPLNIEIGDFTLSLSPYSMLTGGIANRAGNGFALGAGVSLGYDDGKTTFYAGGIGSFRNGLFEGKFSIGGGYNGYQYFWNYYMGKDAQSTGTISIQRGKFSLRWENDVLAQSGDKFRSNATEIGWGDYFIGTNVYTTNPIDYDNKTKPKGYNGSRIFNNRNGTYNEGFQLSSPLYVGMKTKNGIRRIGYNHPVFGDLSQNGFHHLKLPFIFLGIPAMSSGNFQLGNYSSFYYQSGTYTPGILY